MNVSKDVILRAEKRGFAIWANAKIQRQHFTFNWFEFAFRARLRLTLSVSRRKMPGVAALRFGFRFLPRA